MMVWVGLAVVGCTPNPAVRSVKAPGLQGPLRSMFVISDAGSRGELSGSHFQAELERMAGRCRIRMGVSTVSELDLDPEVHVRRNKLFNARYTLIVNLLGTAARTDDVLVGARYDARLYEDSTRIVWRAALRLKLGDSEEYGSERLAYALMAKMGEDGVIQRCATRARTEPMAAHAR
jgi:hypothetical protein